MPYINGVKFACNSCIKGHRSSHCTHADRPLIEIRKKGRPVTQCSYCRHLRKTKQVHIKCLCGKKQRSISPEIGIEQPSPFHPQLQEQFQPQQPKIEPLASMTTGANTATSYADVLTDNNMLPFGLDAFDSAWPASSSPPSSSSSLDIMRQQGAWMGWSPVSPSSSPPPPSLAALPGTTACAPSAASSLSSWSSSSSSSSSPMQCGGSCCVCPPQPLPQEPESVVITITPLNNQDTSRPTITRVVTCHCGEACVCSSCLVHQNQPVSAYHQQPQPHMLGVLC